MGSRTRNSETNIRNHRNITFFRQEAKVVQKKVFLAILVSESGWKKIKPVFPARERIQECGHSRIYLCAKRINTMNKNPGANYGDYRWIGKKILEIYIACRAVFFGLCFVLLDKA